MFLTNGEIRERAFDLLLSHLSLFHSVSACLFFSQTFVLTLLPHISQSFVQAFVADFAYDLHYPRKYLVLAFKQTRPALPTQTMLKSILKPYWPSSPPPADPALFGLRTQILGALPLLLL